MSHIPPPLTAQTIANSVAITSKTNNASNKPPLSLNLKSDSTSSSISHSSSKSSTPASSLSGSVPSSPQSPFSNNNNNNNNKFIPQEPFTQPLSRGDSLPNPSPPTPPKFQSSTSLDAGKSRSRATSKSEKSYYAGSNESVTPSLATLRSLRRREALTPPRARLVIVLVGLPGRGKSFIGRKLEAFINWRGGRCKIFNVGKVRREEEEEQLNSGEPNQGNSNLFSAENKEGAEFRENVAKRCMDQMFEWLESPSQLLYESIAVFDATNSTRSRRAMITAACNNRPSPSPGLVFVESICDDVLLLEENFLMKVRSSPDFIGMSEEEALCDLRARVSNYEAVYETLDDDSASYIKVYNLSAKILANQIYGRLSKVIMPALMAWNIGTRPIWLCRAGETEIDDESDKRSWTYRTRRDANLNERGRELNQALARFVQERGKEWSEERNLGYQPNAGTLNNSEDLGPIGEPVNSSLDSIVEGDTDRHSVVSRNSGTAFKGVRLDSGIAEPDIIDVVPCKIMCSTMPRAYETALFTNENENSYRVEQFSNLNPLDKGDFTGMELAEIAQADPEWYESLKKSPFVTRFPGGECYKDLVSRLEGCLIDMEQQVAPVLVVSHVSVLQCLLAYFQGSPVEECSMLPFPMETVVELLPVKGGGWKEQRYQMLTTRESKAGSIFDVENGSGVSSRSISCTSISSLVLVDEEEGLKNGLDEQGGVMYGEKELNAKAAHSPRPIWGDAPF